MNKLRWVLGVVTVALLAGVVATAVAYPDSGRTACLAFGLVSSAIFALFLAFLLLYETRDEDTTLLVICAFFAVCVFFSSWFINASQTNYLVVTSRGETQLVSSLYFAPPYGKSFSRIAGGVLKGTVAIEAEHGEYVWRAVVTLEVSASYEEAFELLTTHGSAEEWLATVQAVAEEAIGVVARENFSFREPGWYDLEMPQEYSERLLSLGYRVTRVQLGGLRYVKEI